ncbi:MAG: VWA domain-containing protein [Cyanobacteria bacterium]|nr:VWA domain-containing protein [Cyanobacteriota bacterium]
MTRRLLLKALILGASVTTLPVLLLAQKTVPRTIYINAVDDKGAPVLNLTAEDFIVTEDGEKRAVTYAALGSLPVRVVLMVDSSTSMGPMVNTMKTALGAFANALPESEEVVFLSSGGQIRVRTTPESSRDKLRAEIARFASEGGANAFYDTMLEADKRFMKTAPRQWPANVIVTTDNGEATREINVDEYNKFMNDFLARGGTAHAVILQGKRNGLVTDILANLVDNTGGMRTTLLAESSLAARLTDIANRIADDHQRMMRRYSVTYAGDPKRAQPQINVAVSRDDVRLEMSTRRPF